MSTPQFPGPFKHVTAVANGNSVYLYGLDSGGRLWWSSGTGAERAWELTTGQFDANDPAHSGFLPPKR
jgi:hypothetical protein